MSVLIKDMEIPKTCDDCPFHIYHSHYEYVCKATPMFYPMNLANSKGIRKDWCPLSEVPEPCEDTISRQAAIAVADSSDYVGLSVDDVKKVTDEVVKGLKQLPSAQPEQQLVSCSERLPEKEGRYLITCSRIGAWRTYSTEKLTAEDCMDAAHNVRDELPSAQPQRTCVNCGRTANNGGWYADGRTRCPIEEHYALPKDGYCYLWEKRNVADDDYPERMEE